MFLGKLCVSLVALGIRGSFAMHIVCSAVPGAPPQSSQLLDNAAGSRGSRQIVFWERQRGAHQCRVLKLGT
jgi:hypothetical protein